MLLLVKDNGKGFNFSKIKKGHGLRNMEQRASEMDAVIEVSSRTGAGTTVQLKLPIN
jgi:signal transduction histidine kinase